ncbi:MYO15 protein, partial [Polypterus senegalus]
MPAKKGDSKAAAKKGGKGEPEKSKNDTKGTDKGKSDPKKGKDEKKEDKKGGKKGKEEAPKGKSKEADKKGKDAKNKKKAVTSDSEDGSEADLLRSDKDESEELSEGQEEEDKDKEENSDEDSEEDQRRKGRKVAALKGASKAMAGMKAKGKTKHIQSEEEEEDGEEDESEDKAGDDEDEEEDDRGRKRKGANLKAASKAVAGFKADDKKSHRPDKKDLHLKGASKVVMGLASDGRERKIMKKENAKAHLKGASKAVGGLASKIQAIPPVEREPKTGLKNTSKLFMGFGGFRTKSSKKGRNFKNTSRVFLGFGKRKGPALLAKKPKVGVLKNTSKFMMRFKNSTKKKKEVEKAPPRKASFLLIRLGQKAEKSDNKEDSNKKSGLGKFLGKTKFGFFGKKKSDSKDFKTKGKLIGKLTGAANWLTKRFLSTKQKSNFLGKPGSEGWFSKIGAKKLPFPSEDEILRHKANMRRYHSRRNSFYEEDEHHYDYDDEEYSRGRYHRTTARYNPSRRPSRFQENFEARPGRSKYSRVGFDYYGDESQYYDYSAPNPYGYYEDEEEDVYYDSPMTYQDEYYDNGFGIYDRYQEQDHYGYYDSETEYDNYNYTTQDQQGYYEEGMDYYNGEDYVAEQQYDYDGNEMEYYDNSEFNGQYDYYEGEQGYYEEPTWEAMEYDPYIVDSNYDHCQEYQLNYSEYGGSPYLQSSYNQYTPFSYTMENIMEQEELEEAEHGNYGAFSLSTTNFENFNMPEFGRRVPSPLASKKQFRLFPRPQVKLFGKEKLDVPLLPSPHISLTDYDDEIDEDEDEDDFQTSPFPNTALNRVGTHVGHGEMAYPSLGRGFPQKLTSYQRPPSPRPASMARPVLPTPTARLIEDAMSRGSQRLPSPRPQVRALGPSRPASPSPSRRSVGIMEGRPCSRPSSPQPSIRRYDAANHSPSEPLDAFSSAAVNTPPSPHLGIRNWNRPPSPQPSVRQIEERRRMYSPQLSARLVGEYYEDEEMLSHPPSPRSPRKVFSQNVPHDEYVMPASPKILHKRMGYPSDNNIAQRPPSPQLLSRKMGAPPSPQPSVRSFAGIQNEERQRPHSPQPSLKLKPPSASTFDSNKFQPPATKPASPKPFLKRFGNPGPNELTRPPSPQPSLRRLPSIKRSSPPSPQPSLRREGNLDSPLQPNLSPGMKRHNMQHSRNPNPGSLFGRFSHPDATIAAPPERPPSPRQSLKRVSPPPSPQLSVHRRGSVRQADIERPPLIQSVRRPPSPAPKPKFKMFGMKQQASFSKPTPGNPFINKPNNPQGNESQSPPSPMPSHHLNHSVEQEVHHPSSPHFQGPPSPRPLRKLNKSPVENVPIANPPAKLNLFGQNKLPTGAVKPSSGNPFMKRLGNPTAGPPLKPPSPRSSIRKMQPHTEPIESERSPFSNTLARQGSRPAGSFKRPQIAPAQESMPNQGNPFRKAFRPPAGESRHSGDELSVQRMPSRRMSVRPGAESGNINDTQKIMHTQPPVLKGRNPFLRRAGSPVSGIHPDVSSARQSLRRQSQKFDNSQPQRPTSPQPFLKQIDPSVKKSHSPQPSLPQTVPGNSMSNIGPPKRNPFLKRIGNPGAGQPQRPHSPQLSHRPPSPKAGVKLPHQPPSPQPSPKHGSPILSRSPSPKTQPTSPPPVLKKTFHDHDAASHPYSYQPKKASFKQPPSVNEFSPSSQHSFQSNISRKSPSPSQIQQEGSGEDPSGRYAVVMPQVQRMGPSVRTSQHLKQHWAQNQIREVHEVHDVWSSERVLPHSTVQNLIKWSFYRDDNVADYLADLSSVYKSEVTESDWEPDIETDKQGHWYNKTYIGSILVSVNPYKMYNIYGTDVVLQYEGRALGENPPGESGSGKTEATKLILRYLAAIHHKRNTTQQAKNERNYHIFYEMLAGLPSQQKQKLYLQEPDTYYYLNQGGNCEIPGKSDAEDFRRLLSAMEILSFSAEDKNSIFKVLSSILHLGNIYFEKYESDSQEAASVVSAQEIRVVAELLQISPEGLQKSITYKVTETMREKIFTPLTVESAVDARDAVAKILYSLLFSWLTDRINKLVYPKNEALSIAILDIYGFEDLSLNSFEQLCINYANEYLQFFFNKIIFQEEQDEYTREQIQWKEINFSDNQPCIDLIAQKPYGILRILDDQSCFPQATDHSYLQKCHYHHGSNPLYSKPKMPLPEFTIRHYAGKVAYQMVANLFSGHAQVLTQSSLRKNSTVTRRYQAPTVAAKFQQSLMELVDKMERCNPFFVRCIKPNNKQESSLFDVEVVQVQLRYSGIMETIRIRKEGFPARISFNTFLNRYKCLLGLKHHITPDGENCVAVLKKLCPANKGMFQVGVSKLFMKEDLYQLLESKRDRILHMAALTLQRYTRMWFVRRRYTSLRRKIVKLQAHSRGYLTRKHFVKMRESLIKFRSLIHMYVNRKRYIKMKEEIRRRAEEQQKQIEMEPYFGMLTVPLESPLTLVEDELKQEALNIFVMVMRFMGDPHLNGAQENLFGNYIIQKGLFAAGLRDEILSQISNQVWRNPNENNAERGWLLLAACLSSFAPSTKLDKYLLKFVSDHGYNGYKSVCQHKLIQAMQKSQYGPETARTYPLCLLEWMAIRKKAIMVLQVHCFDGESFLSPVHSWSMGEELARDILRHSVFGNGFESDEEPSIPQAIKSPVFTPSSLPDSDGYFSHAIQAMPVGGEMRPGMTTVPAMPVIPGMDQSMLAQHQAFINQQAFLLAQQMTMQVMALQQQMSGPTSSASNVPPSPRIQSNTGYQGTSRSTLSYSATNITPIPKAITPSPHKSPRSANQVKPAASPVSVPPKPAVSKPGFQPPRQGPVRHTAANTAHILEPTHNIKDIIKQYQQPLPTKSLDPVRKEASKVFVKKMDPHDEAMMILKGQMSPRPPQKHPIAPAPVSGGAGPKETVAMVKPVSSTKTKRSSPPVPVGSSRSNSAITAENKVELSSIIKDEDIKKKIIAFARDDWDIYFSRLFPATGSVGTGIQILATSHNGVKLLKLVKSSGTPTEHFKVLRTYSYTDIMFVTIPSKNMLEFNLTNEKLILFSAKAPQVKNMIDYFITELKKDSDYVVAVRNYITDDRTCLSFHKGDIIRLQSMDGLDSGWKFGAIHGRSGIFPTEYVQPVAAPDFINLPIDKKEEPKNKQGKVAASAAVAVAVASTMAAHELDRTAEVLPPVIGYGDPTEDYSSIDIDERVLQDSQYTMVEFAKKYFREAQRSASESYKQKSKKGKDARDPAEMVKYNKSPILESLIDFSDNSMNKVAADMFLGISKACEQNLKKTFQYGGRKEFPSVMELKAMVAGRSSKRQLFLLPGGTERHLKIKTCSIALDVIEELCYEMALHRPEAMEEYAVFVVTNRGQNVRPLNKKEYILDIATEAEHTDSNYTFWFRRVIWCQPLKFDNELCVTMHYNQVLPDYLKALLNFVPQGKMSDQQLQQVSKLAALQHRAKDSIYLPTM